MPVDVRCEAARGRHFAPKLRTEARALLSLFELEHAELSLLLADDRVIRRLNRAYRDKDAATDVLSFAQLAGEGARRCRGGRAGDRCPPLPLGDVVISVETAARQAEALNLSISARLRALLIHGFLHLLGYDHERSPVAARRMFAHERELAARLDLNVVPPPATSGCRVSSGLDVARWRVRRHPRRRARVARPHGNCTRRRPVLQS